MPLVHKVCGLVRWVSSGRGADSRRGRFGCASWVLGRVRFGWLRDAMGLQELVASEALHRAPHRGAPSSHWAALRA